MREGGVYRAEDAQTEAEVRARRPKVPKLVTDPQLAEAVTERLEMGWSPHAVAADLRNEGSLSLVCAETIYQACYEPCGQRGLTAGSWRWLPRRRRRRKPRSRCEQAKRSTTRWTHLSVPQPRQTVANPATGKAICRRP